MGRRPNVVIQEYFQRGPKLTDNSNRYPQTCKLCGEEFPKGRFDSLTNHLTKRCTMISQTQRINACLALNGINASRSPRSLQSRQQQQQQQHQHQHQHAQHAQHQFPQHQTQMPLDLSQLQSQQSWTLTPLETLAEVSRQQITHLNEHEVDGAQSQHVMSDAEIMSGMTTSGGSGDHYHVQDHFVLNSPESATRRDRAEDKQGAMESERQSNVEKHSQTPEETATVTNEAPNLTVAAAAAARLRDSATELDPTLFTSLTGSIAATIAGSLGEELVQVAGSMEPAQDRIPKTSHDTPSPAAQATVPTPSSHLERSDADIQFSSPMSPSDAARLAIAEPNHAALASNKTSVASVNHAQRPTDASAGTTQLPWGQFTYMTTPPAPPKPASMQPMMGIPTRSVFRLDQNGAKGRHSRARFSEPRRKEVQNIRRIGACIRCRILRKTCSQGDPCDTCRKVLTPRIWNTGCIRTKFTDKLDLYGARIQVHHATKAVDEIQRAKDTKHPVVVLEATHSDTGIALVFEALRATEPGEQVDPTRSEEYQTVFPDIVMADTRCVLPELMHDYLDQILPELIHKEEAHFSRITLEMAFQQASATGNRVLKLALDLWGYVEIIERELKWKYSVQASPVAREKARPITKETDPELFKTLGFQMSAAAEMKAEMTSKSLLLHMGRDLQDGRTVIDKSLFCAIMLLLISVEKSTWAFLTWERVPQLKEQWPLPTPPGEFTRQGDELAELLRMLLTIRKALPKTMVREEDDVLTTEDPEYQTFFEQIHLKASDVVQRRLNPPFHATTSRSLELRYCSTILLPEHLLPPQEGAEDPNDDSGSTAATQTPNDGPQDGHQMEAPHEAQGGVEGADIATLPEATV
ncbi:unnamed protein product [Discula destructiva]